MPLIQINEDTCSRCGNCIQVCPGRLIVLPPGEFPREITDAEQMCIRCGHCVAACPSGSLSHRDIPVRNSPQIRQELRITSAQCEQFLKSRRSIREYQDKPVPVETVKKLIEIASYAPTGHNNQEVEWLVVSRKEDLLHLEDIGTGWIRWNISQSTPAASAFDMVGMLKHQEEHRDTFLRGAPVLIVAHAQKGNPMALIDSTIALTYLELAANGAGLGCCWAGLVYFMANNYQPMQEALNLPDGHAAYGCMMLGYPASRYYRIPCRKIPRVIWRSPSENG